MVADLERLCASCWRYNNTTKHQTVRCRTVVLSSCRLVVLSLTMYVKQCVVVRRVVAMSHCRSVQIERLPYKSSDRATTSHLACFARETERQDESATTRRLALCRVVASDKTKRR
jgi:hypothetical protein